MFDQFQVMREIISGHQPLPEQNEFRESCYRRLYYALCDFEKVGAGDIASLVRHVLRGEMEKQGGIAQSMLVPATPPWPDADEWAMAGITILDSRDNFLLIQADEWKPRWLSHNDAYYPEKPLFALDKRANYTPVPGDPFLDALNIKTYLTPGQREAVRSVLMSPPGSTLIVNLPTGSGKSLCAHLPGILFSQGGGLTVVVVPTTALCIDQERSVDPFIQHPAAYYGGTTSKEKERNAGIRERIRNGSQRIVFTSPESLTQSLIGPIYAAAERGYLKLLAIDEAHIVNQWGDEFRSSFQEIAGIRRDLLRACTDNPFITLLLSATITEACLDTLETLFGHPGPVGMVSAVQLRPEPSYWFSHCSDMEAKAQRVLEALHHLPRPLILYTTKVDEAEAWAQVLKNMGYLRCEVVTGKTGPGERLRIVQQWREQQVDIIVATSAFGLGVDQPDVRTVLHACIPESLDRYYQEVGRGGRDGRASLSLVIYIDEDLEVAHSLNKKKIITVERGLQRWNSMFDNKESLGQGKYRVPVNAVPSNDPGDIDMDNKLNLAWNVRTLTLMTRSGLIELDSEDPPQWGHDGEELDADDLAQIYQEKLQNYSNHRVVSVVNNDHLKLETWQRLVEPVRKLTNQFAKKSMQLMVELLLGDRCVSEVFEGIYTIEKCDSSAWRRPVIVSKSCGGCPACRSGQISPYAGFVPSSLPIWPPSNEIGNELERLLGGRKVLAIFYETFSVEEKRELRKWSTLISWLVSQETQNLIAPKELLEQFRKAVKKVPDAYVFFHQEFKPLFIPKVPSLVIHMEGVPVPDNYYRAKVFSSPRILLLPASAVDPAKGHCLLVDTIPCKKYSLEEFCMEVGL